jgi:excisionase family DNA binding protein
VRNLKIGAKAGRGGGRLCHVSEVNEWLTVTEAAERLGLPVTRVQQMLRDGGLAGVRQDDGVLRVPADLLVGDSVLKGLAGVLTLLRDAGYSDDEALRWLHTPDDTLPGTPVQALRGDRGKEVKRRAQALG